MIKLILLFKRAAKTGSFELRYERNLTYLKKMPGVRDIWMNKIIGGPAGEAPYLHIVEVLFDDFDALDAALTSPEGVMAGKDLMDFAGREVELVFAEEVVEKKPLSPQHLQDYLKAEEIAAEIIFPGVPTPTVPAAARALKVDEDQIVKSVVFLVDEKPFLVLGCGTRHVDPRKLAERLNVSRKRVKLADAEQVLEITGYAVGTVPPIGLKTRMAAFMDPAVRAYPTIYAGGGGIDALLRIDSADLVSLTRAEVVSMLEDEEASEA